MTRPTIIRADTIDLQDHKSPSAQDHSKTRADTTSSKTNGLAPHQAETIREVHDDTAEEESRSPRISWTNGQGINDIHQYAEDLTTGVASSLNNDENEKNMNQEDALAIAQNGGVSSSDEGDLDGDGDDLDDDMMDKISSSPSIEDEDIDFEFVYALHTFVATVEGQANATKGDTMVLLDDSNSYWWLVRVVKDSSIGYLPAEHIETPTERLARLNKHRNVDLSAAMLGDQAVKEKASFKQTIRRKRKTVTFAAPTYVDYSDIEYSTDEDDLDDLFAGQTSIVQQAKEAQQQAAAQAVADEEVAEESAKVEPLKPRVVKEVRVMEPAKDELESDEETRSSEEILLESKLDPPGRMRNGTVRNTDSFFRDETVETKKITLTPNLLRDDNQSRPSTESVSKDIKSRTSLDRLDKELMSDKEKRKLKEKEKKDKDKKPSAIRSFFSRKDKKKASEDDDDSLGKRSVDLASDQGRDSESIDEQGSPEKSLRNPSKLQKQMPRAEPRAEPSATRKATTGPPQKSSTMELASYLAESRTNDVSNVPPTSMRIVDPEAQEAQEIRPSKRPTQQERSASAAAQREEKTVKLLPRSASAASEMRPFKASKAQVRMELDELESSDEELETVSEVVEPTEHEQQEKASRPHLPGAFPDTYDTTSTASVDVTIKPIGRERLSESPVHISPVNSHPPALDIDTSSQEGRSSEESPSPELVHGGDDTPRDSSSLRSGKGPSWDDSKLRQFFDEGDHVRDLLVVVYDKSDVEPVGKDHPVVGGLFREQNAKLAEITTQLDNMLGDWLARKQRLRGAL